MNEKAKLRKYEDDLNVSGVGVIVLGIWGIIRVLIEVFLGTKDLLNVNDESPVVRILTKIIVIAFIALVSFIVMKVHLYIGLNAIRAAKGSEYKKGYFVATVIILILSVLSLGTYKEEIQDIDNIDTTIASIIVDLTTIYILTVVIISTLKIKKSKENETGE